MGTRFYYPSSGAAAISPAVDASWTNSTTFRRDLLRAPSATAVVSPGEFYDGALANFVVAQYVSEQLQVQTVSGTVRGQIMALQSDPDTDAYAQTVIRVLSADGSVVRGTLLPAHANALSSEFNTGSMRNRRFPLSAISPASLTPIACLSGDRLVVEVGFRAGGVSPEEVSLRLGDLPASDLAEDETSSTDLRPWIEFSSILLFDGEAVGVPSRSGLGLGLGV